MTPRHHNSHQGAWDQRPFRNHAPLLLRAEGAFDGGIGASRRHGWNLFTDRPLRAVPRIAELNHSYKALFTRTLAIDPTGMRGYERGERWAKQDCLLAAMS